jgi:hypothetical protein
MTLSRKEKRLRMSAVVIDRPNVETNLVDRPLVGRSHARVQSRLAPKAPTRPQVKPKPEVHVRVRIQERKRSRTNPVAAGLCYAVAFFLIFALTAAASGLGGQVMMEKARREGLRAKERAAAARSAEKLLQNRLEELTSVASVQEWATANGFEAADGLGNTSRLKNLVALNH